MAMDLRQLAALTAVADTGTFSAAADALHTVQSNVSTHVARLERELGTTLVDRSAGRLTEEGEVVVARARRIQAELDALVADVASLRDEISGHVRMGVIGTTGRWLMPPLLTAMDHTHPNVTVAVLEGNTTSLLPQLIAGSLEMAVVNLPVADPDIVVEPLFEEDLIVVAPATANLLARAAAGMADDLLTAILVARSGPVLLAPDSPIEDEFVWTLRNVGIDHVLLGSDYPQMGVGAAVDALERLDLSAEEKEKIRRANAAQLFGP